MIKTITIKVDFIGEGNVKQYIRYIEDEDQMPTIKQFTDSLEAVFEDLKVDTNKPATSDL